MHQVAGICNEHSLSYTSPSADEALDIDRSGDATRSTRSAQAPIVAVDVRPGRVLAAHAHRYAAKVLHV
eukprot:14275-Eustigmatos_ZCMA.PRE.1